MTAISMNRADREAIAARHPHLLVRSAWERFCPLVFGATILVYLVFCWWLFAIGSVLGNANWSIAGTYLADWVSYEVRPEIKIAGDGTMTLNYGRYSPLGPDPNPDWVVLERENVMRKAEAATTATRSKAGSTMGFMGEGATLGRDAVATPADAPTEMRAESVIRHAIVKLDSATAFDIRDRIVTVSHAGGTLVVDLARGLGNPGPIPAWAAQKRVGEKLTLSFGATGWAEIDTDTIKIRNRFFGWANFLFDTQSPFFGKTSAEVFSLITIGDRIDPAQSNLSLAWDNILYNSEWQHLDVWTKLLQTIVMAFVGTLFAMIVAFPLSFIAARNITRNRPLNQLTKRFFDFQRSVDMLIWALFFTRGFGPGPLAGISAIFFTDTGTLGKLYAEALENIDDKQREGVKSVGASPLAVQRFGVLPQVMPLFASQALYFWESNTRSATIIGAVGAGGIGLKLWEAMRTNSDWENVAYMVLLILMVVFVFDALSNALRSRLMGARVH